MILLVILYLVYSCFLSPLVPAVRSGDYMVELNQSTTERVCIVDDNEEALLWRLRLIDQAEYSIELATWRVLDDESGRIVMAALADAADRGVQVRLLIDGMESQLHLSKSSFFDALCARPNVEVRFYNPVKFTSLKDVHYRMHEKYLVVDETAYILGGRNTTDLYLESGAQASKAVQDRDILVYETQPGNTTSLAALHQYFEEMWALSTQQIRLVSEDAQNAFEQQAQAAMQRAQQLFGARLTDYDLEEQTMATNGVTFLHGETKANRKDPVLWKQLCVLMGEAQQSIIFQSPQLIASSEMLGDLGQLALDSIDIITNVVARSVNWSGAVHSSERQGLLQAGTSVYESAGEAPLHTKTILIDDRISVIGSFNLDPRSAYLDTEVMVVVDSTELNAELREKAQKVKNASRVALSDGSFEYGEDYVEVNLPKRTAAWYKLLERVLPYFKYLL